MSDLNAPSPTAATTDPMDQWRHLSPLSPLLKGGFALLAVLGFAASQVFDQMLPALTGSSREPYGPVPDQGLDLALTYPLVAFALLVLGIGVIVGLAALSWRFTRFRVTATQVELRSGWLFRAHRQVPIDRIQAVEVSRPLLAQLFGLAQVIVQSAGGGDAHLTLAFLRLPEAHALRRRLQTLSAQSDEAGGARPPDPVDASTGEAGSPGATPGATAAGEPSASTRHSARASTRTLPGELLGYGSAEGRHILAVPNSRLLTATLLNGAVVIPAVIVLLGALISQLTSVDLVMGIALAALPGLVPAVFALGYGRVNELLRNGNFTLSDVGGAVRITHGLTDHRTTTVPLHRVQALELVQPLWWRPMGWWRVRVNVAGTRSSGDPSEQESTVLPVGVLPDAVKVLTLVDPRLDPEVLMVAALGDGPNAGWQLISPRARPLDLLSWRRTGYAVTSHGLLLRAGRLRRTVTIVPHARIQSITWHAGPLDRRLRLASLRFVSTPGSVSPHIDHLDQLVARDLFVSQTHRSRAARKGPAVLAGGPLSGVDWTTHDEEGSV